jgi:2,3-bisphosphoglycerate-independent phosphoglycerate mutase
MTDIDINRGVIRQISVGVDYKNSMHYTVGNTYNKGRFTISDIIESQYDSIYLNIKRYDIYVNDNNLNNNFCWKSLENQPVMIEYFNNLDK